MDVFGLFRSGAQCSHKNIGVIVVWAYLLLHQYKLARSRMTWRIALILAPRATSDISSIYLLHHFVYLCVCDSLVCLLFSVGCVAASIGQDVAFMDCHLIDIGPQKNKHFYCLVWLVFHVSKTAIISKRKIIFLLDRKNPYLPSMKINCYGVVFSPYWDVTWTQTIASLFSYRTSTTTSRLITRTIFGSGEIDNHHINKFPNYILFFVLSNYCFVCV